MLGWHNRKFVSFFPSVLKLNRKSRKVRLTTFWEERRVIFICFLIGFAQFQYEYDSAAVSGFQSMAGFLRIFGYPDVQSVRSKSDKTVALLYP